MGFKFLLKITETPETTGSYIRFDYFVHPWSISYGYIRALQIRHCVRGVDRFGTCVCVTSVVN